jgi:hypothetical protein
MSPLIEEARRRQRRRRLTLLAAVLVLAGAAAAVVGTTQMGSPRGQHRTLSSALQPIPNGAAMPVMIRVRGRPGRWRVMAQDALGRNLRRGDRVVTELRLDPKTGKYEVRLTTSH